MGAHAQADYPSKPIKLLMGFPPGGSGDFVGRVLGDEMSRLLGQSVVGENRPGAGSNLASEAVAKAPPDGYTLLLGGSFSHSVNPALFAKMPVDVAKDFSPIGKIVSSPTVFAVPATLAANSLRDFIAYARAEGDKINYASAGNGSPGHIAGGYFSKAAGLRMTHVPYKGSGESVRALIAGEVQLIITSPTAIMGFVKEGRAKALALTSAKASPLVPGVPGAAEAGLPNFDFSGWYGLFGPAGLPRPVVARLHAALNQALANTALRERLAGQGLEVDMSASPEAFARFTVADRQAMAQVVRDSGARVE
jgi:tripartite-type tricarboxylate transporter receptor subunit TctC